MTKQVHVVTVGDKQFDFTAIKHRTVKAPVISVKLRYLRNSKPSGIATIDKSDIRLCKIDGKNYYVLTGHTLVSAALAALTEENSDAEINAKLMSKRFLELTKLPPKVISGTDLQLAASALKEHFHVNKK